MGEPELDFGLVDEKNQEQLFDNLVWINSEEAACYLRKTVGALRTAVCRGHIHARRFRRRLYFKRSELARMIELSEHKGDLK